MISTHEFEPWHIDELPNIRKEYGCIDQYVTIMRRLAASDECPIFTIADDMKPIGIIGGSFIYPEVMQVFALLSDDIKKNPKDFHKEVKRIIDLYFDKGLLTRMEMDVRCSFAQAVVWAERLGFTREGVKKNYSFDNSDHYLYARYN